MHDLGSLPEKDAFSHVGPTSKTERRELKGFLTRSAHRPGAQREGYQQPLFPSFWWTCRHVDKGHVKFTVFSSTAVDCSVE